MRLLLHIVVFWEPSKRQCLDVNLWCPSSSSTTIVPGHCLTCATALLRTPHFGLIKWVGVFQWQPSPTFVHTEYESGIDICLVRVTNSCNPQVFIIQVWLMLSKDRLTRIKFGKLYVKLKVRLFRAGDKDYLSKVGCDYVILFISQAVVEGVKKRGKRKLAKIIITETLYSRRVYRMCHKFGNRWIEYWQPIDMLDQPSNMEIGLC